MRIAIVQQVADAHGESVWTSNGTFGVHLEVSGPMLGGLSITHVVMTDVGSGW